MLSSEVRSRFLKFFEDKGHSIVESSSVVPRNDPSLLFTNSGMVQFKNVFTGLETRSYSRASTSQKCIRAGGKHNDLDQVGFTARHHTFFEMLGNFSFGDYFKEEAIYFAWKFLTGELGLPKNKLIVTVYHDDEEAMKIWRKVAGDVVVIPISSSDNFWSMGDSGPCGPCSEIFFDHGADVPGGMPGTPEENGDRYVEIWNIVFMQFDQKQNGERLPLKKKSIDTGMGLERITAVIQGFHDNYESDLFSGLINNVREISNTNYENVYPSYKVIADHVRSISFLVADGVVPSNEGRGYVLRRILRRAMRHGNLIEIRDPFLFRLSSILVDEMKSVYPELEKARSTIASIIKNEEEKFLDTLERGLKILKTGSKNIPAGGVLDGTLAFKLYDTYGFPLDLTQDILKSEKISVDIDGFEICLNEQKNRAKWTGSGASKEGAVWHIIREKFGETEFVGYEKESYSSKILGIVKDGEEIKSVSKTDGSSSGEKVFIITESSPFYAESGGQCGDTGTIESKSGKFIVTNTVKFCDSIVAHEGMVLEGSFCQFDLVFLEIYSQKRRRTKANHTAAHLLQSALRRVLGDHVVQRGSFLNDERLRFDFSHNSALSAEEISKIESAINDWISRDLPVMCKTLSREEAMSSGAMALFGEKYGDIVRTIQVCSEKNEEEIVSFELCGGTHVSSTAEIGILKIVSESSIGSGIRRIEAITGFRVLKYLNDIEGSMKNLSESLKCAPSEIAAKVCCLLAELKEKNQKILFYKQKIALSNVHKIEKTDGCIFSTIIEGYSIEEMRSLAEVIRSKNPSGIIVLASTNADDERVSAVVGVSQDLQNRYNAAQLLRLGVDVLGGKGGGSAAFAQGGGSGKSKVSHVVKKIEEAVL